MEIERERNAYDNGHSDRKFHDLSQLRKDGSAGFLVWEELTVALSNRGTGGHTKRLIRDVSGYAEPGRIMAIMGPSGSGKSTLLDALAGRLAGNVVQTGNILLNGRKRRLDYGILAYVTQENILLGTLTVRETITYSAYLRFPSTMTKEEIMGEVETVIIKMGLQDCADRNIGNWHLRGISGGEQKRLCIAIEILTHPVLLFLDEPTSGLDSASAFFVIQTLRNMAREGKTVVCSIHQPSSEVFALFDDLTLLSGGEAVYFGDAKSATEFFSEAGFPCPNRRNPSDHFLRCVNSDFDRVTASLIGSQRIRSFSDVGASSDPLARMATAHIKKVLADTYKSSEYSAKARARMDEISHFSEDLGLEGIKGSQANWWKQLYILTRRSFSNMYRDMGYYKLRIVIYILVSLCVGTIYFNVGTSYTAIFARGSCGAFISGFLAFMSIGGFPSFIEEMKVFYRERLNGHYGVAVFILSNFFSSMPFLLLISFISGSMIFFMVRFHPGVSRYLYLVLNLYGCMSVVESLMMIVASLVPNFLMGIITGAGVIGILMMTSGFFRLLPDLPKPIWRYPISYLSYGSWALQGGYKNDLIGLEFDPMIGKEPKISGEDVIRDTYGIGLARSKWWDLAAIFFILICYRVMFFFVLKIKERISPLFRTLLSNRTLKQLKRRPSWRRKPSSFRLVPHRPLNPENSPTI